MKNNNTSIKIFFSLSFLLFAIISVQSQNKIKFQYDDAGNQIERRYIVAASRPSPQIDPLFAETNAIQIYPNPTSSTVTLKWEDEYVGLITLVEVQAYNSFFKKSWKITEKQNSILIDLTSQPSGLYYVNFHLSDGNIISKTIVKI